LLARETPVARDPDGVEKPVRRRRPLWLSLAEAIAVFVSPVAAFVVLRIRPMATPNLSDPAMHTIYVIDPHDIFERFAGAYGASARLREAARVGFLVPARIDYLLFGAVRGFFVTRYVFALIAIVPAYLLLKRLYSRAAGAAGIIVILSCPVVLTAWGTDYPDSAVVSYMIGALGSIAMPASGLERRLWIGVASALMTMAVWAHSASVPLVAATVAVYVVYRSARDRRGLALDVVVLGAVAVVVTGALLVASGLLIGQYNFITPTWDAYRYLSEPAQVAQWHATGWRWITYLPYLLVPPAVLVSWLVIAFRRRLPTGSVLVGLVCLVQTAVFAVLQFFGDVESLEQHYFSSMLWGSVCLTLAVTIIEASRPFAGSRYARWIPAAIVLAVPLVYEASPREHPYLWVAAGLVLALVVVAGSVLSRCSATARGAGKGILAMCLSATGVVALVGGSLYLTADPVLRDPYLNWVEDPAPAYFAALGTGADGLVDRYRIASQLPAFVGNASYRNEQLLMWWDPSQVTDLDDLVGLYHFVFNSLPSAPPELTGGDVSVLEARRPAEILLLSTTDTGASGAIASLSGYEPVLLRAAVLRSDDVAVYVWLINLKVFGRAS
jgi:hypothetical protein